MDVALVDAFVDSLRMMPWLLVVYSVIELVEFKWGARVRSGIMKAGKAGPAIGAVFGAVPQCGFSVVSSCLYTERLITLGTLLAVYLATSDEAIPVILAHPERAHLVWPLLLTKVLIGVVAGYAVDLVLSLTVKPATIKEVSATAQDDSAEGVLPKVSGIDEHGTAEEGCCHHTMPPAKAAARELIWHPLAHTLKVFLFIFATSLALNLIVARFGDAGLGRLLLSHSPAQPVVAALIGLIPNCAASVAITEAYLRGALSFGSAISGLSASAGLGILVLLKDNRDTKDTARVVGLLVAISVAAGMLIQVVVG